jgi:hypothetical protein
MTKEDLWKAIEAYRMARSSEEHWARRDHIEAALDDLFRGVSGAQAGASVPRPAAHTTGEPSGHPTTAEPVAWMHDQPGRVDVIHKQVKDLWLKMGQPAGFYKEVAPAKVEHYTIPLYAAPQPDTKSREVMALALDALVLARGYHYTVSIPTEKAINALRTALGETK